MCLFLSRVAGATSSLNLAAAAQFQFTRLPVCICYTMIATDGWSRQRLREGTGSTSIVQPGCTKPGRCRRRGLSKQSGEN
jgi:hypothetical protein